MINDTIINTIKEAIKQVNKEDDKDENSIKSSQVELSTFGKIAQLKSILVEK
jgi:hypothetical protein